ncbi:MAG: hypothetical protein ACI4JZ_04600 [Oscillospiraceae bacterium]
MNSDTSKVWKPLLVVQILLAAAAIVTSFFSFTGAIIILVVAIGVAIGLAAIANKSGLPVTGSITSAILEAVALIFNVLGLSTSDNPDFTSTVVFGFITIGCCIAIVVISAVGIAKK